VVTLLFLLAAPAAIGAPGGARAGDPVVLEVSPAVISAARALGPRASFFTARAQPLASLGELVDPVTQVGTGDVAGAKELQALLRAGGAKKIAGGAVDLMQLVSAHHLSSLFRDRPRLRFFVIQARDDGREQAIADTGGGVRVLLRGPGEGPPLGVAESKRAAALERGPFVTSFGPLVGAELSAHARHRHFDAREGARSEPRSPQPGHTFLVLHLDRDFRTGVGLVSFLFGSGIIVTPAFDQLRVVDAARKSFPLAAVWAEGRTVELAYEIPGEARGLILSDGDAEVPLGPLLAKPAAARD
jgi:hypothetical protein